MLKIPCYFSATVKRAWLLRPLNSCLQVDTDWLTKNSGIPLLDIKLQLIQLKGGDPKNPQYEVHFAPVLDKEEGDKSLEMQVNNWANDYKNLASCIKRVDKRATDAGIHSLPLLLAPVPGRGAGGGGGLCQPNHASPGEV